MKFNLDQTNCILIGLIIALVVYILFLMPSKSITDYEGLLSSQKIGSTRPKANFSKMTAKLAIERAAIEKEKTIQAAKISIAQNEAALTRYTQGLADRRVPPGYIGRLGQIEAIYPLVPVELRARAALMAELYYYSTITIRDLDQFLTAIQQGYSVLNKL